MLIYVILIILPISAYVRYQMSSSSGKADYDKQKEQKHSNLCKLTERPLT